MYGGGGDVPQPSPPENGGKFLLQLIRNPPQMPQQPPPPHAATGASPPTPSPPLTHDPAVAAVGPTLPFPPFPFNNGHDLPPYQPPWPQLPPFAPHHFFLRGPPPLPPQNPNPNPNWPSPPPPPRFNHTHHHQPPQLNHGSLDDDIRKLGFSGTNPRPISTHQQEHKLMFGSLPCEIRNNEGVSNGNAHDDFSSRGEKEALAVKEREINSLNLTRDSSNSRLFRNHEQEQRRGGGRGRGRGRGSDKHKHGGNYGTMGPPSQEMRRTPPGFSGKPKDAGHWESRNRGRSLEHNVDREGGRFGEQHSVDFTSKVEDDREREVSAGHMKARGDILNGLGLSSQLDCPGPSKGSNHHSVSASYIEESLSELHGEIGEDEKRVWKQEKNMKKDGDKNDKRQRRGSREKGYRLDMRGQNIIGQRMRKFKRQIDCRADIDRLNAPFLAIYESLIPAEEEKAKQKQLLTSLENLVSKEWPGAQLYLYGSCANSFGVSNCDIDVCLAIKDIDVDKSEVLLKLADILQSNNLQNVQIKETASSCTKVRLYAWPCHNGKVGIKETASPFADALTRARVPIVKLLDPVTGISCDICINNMLAVVNTKLLRDYAQIDVRLRQLAFIVKHWAKSRGVNETYRGTLSSYAYVLMCIHFLQQHKPAILPCLQEMEKTYAINIENVECAYFDQVEKLHDFGCGNNESIAQLVWAFFNYWAYRHDYANGVISIRTGSLLSKQAKDWTRRIENDRHLICIEDPFVVSHDLGRVVDKRTINVLREEFELAADIMQSDPDPSVKLFEPYAPA